MGEELWRGYGGGCGGLGEMQGFGGVGVGVVKGGG